MTPISQEDRELAESFWEDCGEELLCRLPQNNIPCYLPSPQSPYVANAASSICFWKYLYYKKHGKKRMEWLTDYPKEHFAEKEWFWELNPIDIECQKQSIVPETLKFRYILKERWPLKPPPNVYCSLIETDLSGRILRRSVANQSNNMSTPPFSFPITAGSAD